MSQNDQEQGVLETSNSAATPAAAADPAAPPAPNSEKDFVPFFNEDYVFKLGMLGDVGTAYRLGAIFVLMLIAAVLMYLCAWWWVGTHPLAQHH